MKIVSSAVAMQSRHASIQRTEESQSLRAWVTPPPQPASAPMSAPPPAAPAAAGSAQDSQTTDAANWRLLLIKAFIEWLTGKPVKLFDASQLKDAGTSAAAVSAPPAPPATPAPSAPPRAGFGLEYDYHASRQEIEETDFAAQGRVTTADGREVDFALDVEMSRSFSEQTDVSLRAGDAARRADPLVVNLGGSPAQLSAERTSFDLNADGKTENVPLLAGGGAYLALDLNGNGRIDSGAELFGPSTGSGFGELAKYDSDGNGWIDENDPIFKQLRLWQPAANGDGQLSALQDQNVGALFLGRSDTSFQLRGAQNEDLGAVRTTGLYLAESGQAGSIQQVDLTA